VTHCESTIIKLLVYKYHNSIYAGCKRTSCSRHQQQVNYQFTTITTHRAVRALRFQSKNKENVSLKLSFLDLQQLCTEKKPYKIMAKFGTQK